MARPRGTSAASDNSSVPDQHQELGSMYDYLAKVVLIGPSGTGKSCLLHRFVKAEWRVLSSQTIGVEFASKIVKVGSGSNRRRIKLQLWDTAGTERFRSVSRSYYRGAAGAILVYDVSNLATFNALPTFLSDARALASPNLALILAGNKNDLADTSSKTQAQHINGATSHRGTQSDTSGGATPSSASSRQSYLPYDASGGTSSTRSRGGSVNLTGQKWTATVAEGREVSPELVSRWASKALVPVTMEVSALTGDNVDELFNRLGRMILTKIELGEIDPDDPASGIQYGDGGAYADGMSIHSGTTAADEGTLRRRGNRRKRGGGVLHGLSEWEDVFRRPQSRGGRTCC
ncbi:hypothetical protein PV10_01159 [Exophiala mesophila]|uniref:GTP-binding protein ypt4 n=1 Tax=Exophiala mesophila TaxID=212818 RepID=A0A0D1ZTZ3_EXOME|nr:uncharacterized protein PV10_01159 [Exophiala mesophila]KIV97404.1 hypothetical protein PV10_01159 [Exophiala mesophila]